MRFTAGRRLAIVAAGCAAFGGAFATAGAITASAIAPTSCVVNTTSDEFSSGPGTCDSTLGAGNVSLRSAIGAFTAAPSVGPPSRSRRRPMAP